MDVVVVIVFCLGVVNFVVSGIGGGLFLFLWLLNGIVIVYDMCEIVLVVVYEVGFFFILFF